MITWVDIVCCAIFYGLGAWKLWELVNQFGKWVERKIRTMNPRNCPHARTAIWEPHLAGARKCLDCGLVYNPNMNPKWYFESE